MALNLMHWAFKCRRLEADQPGVYFTNTKDFTHNFSPNGEPWVSAQSQRALRDGKTHITHTRRHNE